MIARVVFPIEREQTDRQMELITVSPCLGYTRRDFFYQTGNEKCNFDISIKVLMAFKLFQKIQKFIWSK